MARVDNAAAIRDRAYEIWMEEGCPSGREHLHWAQAAAEIERQAEPVRATASGSAAVEAGEGQEIDRLRRALWEPDHFDIELFGRYSPLIETARPNARLRDISRVAA